VCLVLALFRQRLDLLRLAREIDGGDLLAAPSELRLIGDDGEHHGDDGGHAPTADPPQRTAVELVLLGEKSRQYSAGIFSLVGAGRLVGMLCHVLLEAPGTLANHRETLSGIAPRTRIPAFAGNRKGFMTAPD